MRHLTKQIKQALAALAHADAGEMLGRRDKADTLQAAPAPAPAPTQARRGAVALSVGRVLAARNLDYAIEACQRMDAELVVLAASRDAAYLLLTPHRRRLAQLGLPCRIEQVDAPLRASLLRLLRDHAQIMFLVCGGFDDPAQCLLQPRARSFGRAAAPVPIVVLGADGDVAEAEPQRRRGSR